MCVSLRMPPLGLNLVESCTFKFKWTFIIIVGITLLSVTFHMLSMATKSSELNLIRVFKKLQGSSVAYKLENHKYFGKSENLRS